jgi:hypothetical protein
MKQYQKEIEDLRRLLEEGSGESDEEEEEEEGDEEEEGGVAAVPSGIERLDAGEEGGAADAGEEKGDRIKKITATKKPQQTKEKATIVKKAKKIGGGKANKSAGELLEMKNRIEEEKKRLLEEKDMAEEERKQLEKTLRQNEEVSR